MHKLTVVIITFNEENRIRLSLESVKWCDEIIVVDSCSTDKTLDICREYKNCKIYTQPFLGYGQQKQYAVEKASNDWILSIDADEVVTTDLKNEIKGFLSLPDIPFSGFNVPITLIFMKRIFRYGYENKQPHLRLFNKNKGNFDASKLHENVIISGPVINLKNELMHCSYVDITHYFKKFNDYTTIYKDEALKKGKQVSKIKSVLRFPIEFFKHYLLRLNFLNGYEGFCWSLISAFSVFVKYIKLYEANLK